MGKDAELKQQQFHYIKVSKLQWSGHLEKMDRDGTVCNVGWKTPKELRSDDGLRERCKETMEKEHGIEVN